MFKWCTLASVTIQQHCIQYKLLGMQEMQLRGIKLVTKEKKKEACPLESETDYHTCL